MQIRKSLDKLIALAGGCLVFATGGGTIAATAAMMGSGASLFNAWRESKEKHGPESERILAQVREKVRGEFDAGEALSEEDKQLLDSADHALDAVLLDSIPPPARLAEAFGQSQGFAKAAATLVLAEVAARDELFAEAGERAAPLARRFALAAIEAAMETALTNQAYFSRLLPFVLESIKRDTAETQGVVARVDTNVSYIRAATDRTVAGVQRLLDAFDATSTGRRARRVIDDSRPFVVLARRINQEVDDPNQALVELTEMVELVLRQQAEAEQGTNLGDLVDLALRRIAEKSRRGEFDAAATDAARVFGEWEERESDRRKAEQQAGLRLIEANIDQNMLRRDVKAVAGWVERRVGVEEGGKEVNADMLGRSIQEWYERGEQKGLNLDLEVAEVLARRTLALCEPGNKRGAVLNSLGLSLRTLGARENGTRRLDEAIKTFQAAGAQYGRDLAPLKWAQTQINLGNALAILGERQSGTGRLEQAVTVYRAALEVLTRRTSPASWAGTQNNLANVLAVLSEREGGSARLEEAVVAYRAALEESTREQAPADWARTQNNLGNALVTLGEQAGDAAMLEEAVQAFRAALEERKREQVPLAWAMTQSNLGIALLALGERESGTARFKEAVRAFKVALEEYRRDRVPLDWAMTNNNLGTALAAWGRRTKGIARLTEAAAAFRAALKEYRRESVPLDWAGAQSNLAMTNGIVAYRTRDLDGLKGAIALSLELQAFVLSAGHGSLVKTVQAVLASLESYRKALGGKS